ncbi:hypothetical protein KBY19_32255, partial [Streptomyces sp. B15]|nr:hypothetical protein [Streptomyces sp. B15]
VHESERRWSEPSGAEDAERIDVEEAADLSRAADLDADVAEQAVEEHIAVEPDEDADGAGDEGPGGK